jgi:photosystem II stability/assembly factor-like uncharacterized protein
MKVKSKKAKVKILSVRLCLCGLFLFCSLIVHGQWIKQAVNTTASFRGLSVVNEKVVWASGTGGTVIRTVDGGKTWKVMTVPGAEKLDFRDIEAFDANTAYILSIGNGESSRIYKTIDGGRAWKLQFKNDDPKKFFDAIACWDSRDCIAMSDPVDGFFPLIMTNDGGTTWFPLPNDVLPVAENGEAAFAASGTCLITDERPNYFIVTGGQSARVLRALQPIDPLGRLHWLGAKTEFPRGAAGSGIFSIAMFDKLRGVMVGGNYEKPDEHDNNLAFTANAGETWRPGKGLSGYRSGVTYVDGQTIIAVGTNGTDLSTDGGKTWAKIGIDDLNAVAAKGTKAVWAVGPKGMVAKLK